MPTLKAIRIQPHICPEFWNFPGCRRSLEKNPVLSGFPNAQILYTVWKSDATSSQQPEKFVFGLEQPPWRGVHRGVGRATLFHRVRRSLHFPRRPGDRRRPSIRQLCRLQNALPAALITALVGGIAHGLSANSNLSLPFGPIVFKPDAGAKIFGFVPWTIPLLWVIAIFNARGVARLILRPWRKVKNYGFRLVGLTTLLVVAFDIALEPFAWHVKHFWFWQRTKLSQSLGKAPRF